MKESDEYKDNIDIMRAKILPILSKILNVRQDEIAFKVNRSSGDRSKSDVSIKVPDLSHLDRLNNYSEDGLSFTVEPSTLGYQLIKAEIEAGEETRDLSISISSEGSLKEYLSKMLKSIELDQELDGDLEMKSITSKRAIFTGKLKDSSKITRDEMFNLIKKAIESDPDHKYITNRVERDSKSSVGYLEWKLEDSDRCYRLYLKPSIKVSANILSMIGEAIPITLLMISPTNPPRFTGEVTEGIRNGFKQLVSAERSSPGIEKVLEMMEDPKEVPQFEQALRTKSKLVNGLAKMYAEKAKEDPDGWKLNVGEARWLGMTRLQSTGGLRDRADLRLNRKCSISLKEDNSSAAQSRIFLCNTSIFSFLKSMYELNRSLIPSIKDFSSKNPEMCYKSILGAGVDNLLYKDLVRKCAMRMLGSYREDVSYNDRANKNLLKYILGDYRTNKDDVSTTGYNRIVCGNESTGIVSEMGVDDEFISATTDPEVTITELKIDPDFKKIIYKYKSSKSSKIGSGDIDIYLLDRNSQVKSRDGGKSYLSKSLKFKTLHIKK